VVRDGEIVDVPSMENVGESLIGSLSTRSTKFERAPGVEYHVKVPNQDVRMVGQYPA
jgi:hypothetical protein